MENKEIETNASKFSGNDLVTVNLRQENVLKLRHDNIEDIQEESHKEELHINYHKYTQAEIERHEAKQMTYKEKKTQETKRLRKRTFDDKFDDQPISKSQRTSNVIYQDNNASSIINGVFEILAAEFFDFDQAESLAAENIDESMTSGNLTAKTSEKESKETELSIEDVRKQLPIYKYKDKLIETIKENQIVIIEGETGSGKTTQIPQYLFEAGYCANNKKIGCAQPWRVATMSVAARVAQEMNVELGDRVSYWVTKEKKVSDQTQIEYTTHWLLSREFQNDPEMSAYSVLIIDDAHERTFYTDVLFGLLKVVMKHRKDLKIVISSATCDLKFTNFFRAPFIKIPGRRFPVETYYTADHDADYVAAHYVRAAVITVLHIHVNQPDGDVLVFLSDKEEINDAMNALAKRIDLLGSRIGTLNVLPIYADLPADKLSQIFSPTPPGTRKIVLATNIAETSLTIDGIKYVIDCGYCMQRTFDPRTRIDSLKILPITRANAIQRSGRAGRVGPGKCFRLYKKCTFEDEFDDQAIPEIQRTNPETVVFKLKSLGVKDITKFEFMDTPLDRSAGCIRRRLDKIEDVREESAIYQDNNASWIENGVFEILAAEFFDFDQAESLAAENIDESMTSGNLTAAAFMKKSGRRFPVETYYTADHDADYVRAAVITVLHIHVNQPDGDVLVFLTDKDEIDYAMDALATRINLLCKRIRELIVLPIYAARPTEEQSRIFFPTPPGTRKIVLATDIAETSHTIDGIKYVIDCGYCMQRTFDPRTWKDSWKIVSITRANAIQRSSRAGRVGPGKCFRLYKKCKFDDEFDDS